MNLQQLRYICAIAAHELSISRAAEALNIAQPAISRQLQLLEREIGATIFVRNQKRIISIAPAGESILKIARRISQDIDNIQRIGAEQSAPNEGNLTVATNHTYARYSLPTLIQKYSLAFPKIRVTLYEGNPDEIGKWLADGMADISVSTKPKKRYDNLAFVPFATLERVVVVPPGHKLLKVEPLTLEKLAEFPIISFHQAYPGGENIERAFRLNGITPHFKIMAANADVAKAFVRRKLGIGIISALGICPLEDRDLRTIDASHLFPSQQVFVGLRRGYFLQSHTYEFLALFAPHIPRSSFERMTVPIAVARGNP